MATTTTAAAARQTTPLLVSDRDDDDDDDDDDSVEPPSTRVGWALLLVLSPSPSGSGAASTRPWQAHHRLKLRDDVDVLLASATSREDTATGFTYSYSRAADVLATGEGRSFLELTLRLARVGGVERVDYVAPLAQTSATWPSHVAALLVDAFPGSLRVLRLDMKNCANVDVAPLLVSVLDACSATLESLTLNELNAGGIRALASSWSQAGSALLTTTKALQSLAIDMSADVQLDSMTSASNCAAQRYRI